MSSFLQIFEGRVVELELPLERAVGQAAPPLEHGDRLVEDFLKGHDGPFPSLVAPCHPPGRYHTTGDREGVWGRMHIPTIH